MSEPCCSQLTPSVSPGLQLTPSVPPCPQLTLSVPPTPRSSQLSSNHFLEDPDEIIKKYPKLLNLANIHRLANRRSCEAYFWKDLLKKLTVVGCKDKPPLPKKTVLALKSKKLVSLFPQFISTPLEFEGIWCKCIGAINHCAANLRAKNVTLITL